MKTKACALILFAVPLLWGGVVSAAPVTDPVAVNGFAAIYEKSGSM
jgi:hypothetical protein